MDDTDARKIINEIKKRINIRIIQKAHFPTNQYRRRQPRSESNNPN
jgi:hypothetical protein